MGHRTSMPVLESGLALTPLLPVGNVSVNKWTRINVIISNKHLILRLDVNSFNQIVICRHYYPASQPCSESIHMRLT